MIHPCEGPERLLNCDPVHSGIYDNPDTTWILQLTGVMGSIRPSFKSFTYPKHRRYIVPYLPIISTTQRRSFLTQLLVHTAKYKRAVPTVTPTAALYRLGRKLPKPHGLQGVLMSRETFVAAFARTRNRTRRLQQTLDALDGLSPVFEDEVPPGLVIGTAYPEFTGVITYDWGRSLFGAAVVQSGITAVKVKP